MYYMIVTNNKYLQREVVLINTCGMISPLLEMLLLEVRYQYCYTDLSVRKLVMLAHELVNSRI
jgi:hypothetical protein